MYQVFALEKICNQKIRRCGEKETVNIYYMLIDDTIDTLVWDILNEKKKVIGTIMGEDDIINEFIKKVENGS